MNAYVAPLRLRFGEIVTVAAGIAGTYLALTAFLLIDAVQEYQSPGTSEGSFVWGFSMLATLPLSWWAGDADTLHTLAVYGVCAVINALFLVGAVAGAAYVAIRLSATSARHPEMTDRG